jgi:hypothetical protein
MESTPGRSIVGTAGILGACTRGGSLGAARGASGSAGPGFASHRRPVVGSAGRRCARLGCPRALMGCAQDRGAGRSPRSLMERPGRTAAPASESRRDPRRGGARQPAVERAGPGLVGSRRRSSPFDRRRSRRRRRCRLGG